MSPDTNMETNIDPAIPDEFIDLFERLCEGDIDEAGRQRLVELLRERPELRREVSKQFAVVRGISQLDACDADFAVHTALHVEKIANEDELSFARKVTGLIIRRRIITALAIAAVLAIAIIPLLWRGPGAARGAPPQVARLVRLTDDDRVISSEPLHAGSRIEEAGGLFRLDFDNGAVVAIEAPTRFSVVSDMELQLDSGRLNAWCPDSAHGFTVRTSQAAATDLGTSFGVNASTDGRAEFVVLDGLIEVAKGEEKVTLGEGTALRADSSQGLHSVAFDPSKYRDTWALAYGIISTRDAVVPPEPDVQEKLVQLEDDQWVFVIPERRNVPFNLPIEAQMVEPGTLPGSLPNVLHKILPRPGKRLSSFLIRYNPVGQHPEDYFVKFEGEVTFDRRVLAIITSNEALQESDAVFATGTWPSLFRGIELQQIKNPPDKVTLSEDRRTVKVTFYAGASTDEVRVILEDN